MMQMVLHRSYLKTLRVKAGVKMLLSHKGVQGLYSYCAHIFCTPVTTYPCERCPLLPVGDTFPLTALTDT